MTKTQLRANAIKACRKWNKPVPVADPTCGGELPQRIRAKPTIKSRGKSGGNG
jgi:hypothetical protein